jgi:hypothetical protein
MVNADSINAFILKTITSEAERLKASAEIQETLDRLVWRVSNRKGAGAVASHAANEISSFADYGYTDNVLDWITQTSEGGGTMSKPTDEEIKEFEDHVKDTLYDTADFLRTLNGQSRLHADATN